MSLKPLKKSDAKKQKNKLEAKKRNKQLTMLPPKILIVSEGTKTEPYYFEILADRINENSRAISKNPRVIVEVEGTGKNTYGLYNHLEDNYTSEKLHEYKEIWLVYDKDDFPADRFDNVDAKARNKKDSRFHAAWSNQSFELWLLWHYQDYSSETHRTEYIKCLEKYVLDYRKGDRSIYEKILAEGDARKAISRAKKQKEWYEQQGVVTPSKMACASMVYKLVEELLSYLPES